MHSSMNRRIMKNNDPFEEQWLNKLEAGLTKIGKARLYKEIKKTLLSENKIEWSQLLMEFLSDHLNDSEIREVMCSCACLKPKDDLQYIKNEYDKTKDVAYVHNLLQQYFEKFIRAYKNLNEDQMEFLRKNGWGLAGKLEGDVIYSTKIPKDFHNYFIEDDPLKKRFLYCHCPRIRESILEDKPIDDKYCYCGAGFYKDIWEYILQKEVKVQIIKSIMKGDDVCQIAIYHDVIDKSS